ncbi:unnamed protein product [Bursaphelenchus okinawaensis]|uniref:S-adenosylmethionine decarboxylase proenzyme n=1 Tax=Bursaphelenchus okinawaensis TaxID=465554 RepID=A0A811JS20_9BILA|nr:unnamed protein product [Bursaphelenchus okinawaensis]CAG9080606.1 unnamed protein product [Bursaphelenchus okinawaensis]
MNQKEVEMADLKDADYFFEGAEKLLELWFRKEDEPNATSLKDIPRDEIVGMLEVAQCHILHHTSNQHLDSYVLSESSLFVSDTRLILKTCGATRLLAAIPCILSLARKYAGMREVEDVYYSRKNFLKPHLQPEPHHSFEHEVAVLSRYFPGGSAYCMGPLNTDRWYLFTKSKRQAPPSHADHTLEVLMTEVPDDVLKTFSKLNCDNGKECTKKSGISQLVPFGTEIHEELFEPVGYSMNGLVKDTEQYVTVHVTPEPDFCFVSFETNQRGNCLYKQTLKVLDTFKPNSFMLTLFSNEQSRHGKMVQNRLWQENIPGYERTSLQYMHVGYDTLIYAQFRKKDNGATFAKLRQKIYSEANSEVDDDDSNGSDL